MNTQTDKRLGINFLIIRRTERGVEMVMQQRDQNSWQFKGCWCIPGGGLKEEDAGSYAKTASREASGETGIDIAEGDWKTLCERPEHNPGLVLIAEVAADTKVTCGEGAAMEWKTLAEFEVFAREGLIGYGHEEWLLPHVKAYISEQNEHTEELRLPPVR